MENTLTTAQHFLDLRFCQGKSRGMLLIVTWLIYSGMSKHNEAKTTFKKLGKLREAEAKLRCCVVVVAKQNNCGVPSSADI